MARSLLREKLAKSRVLFKKWGNIENDEFFSELEKSKTFQDEEFIRRVCGGYLWRGVLDVPLNGQYPIYDKKLAGQLKKDLEVVYDSLEELGEIAIRNDSNFKNRIQSWLKSRRSLSGRE